MRLDVVVKLLRGVDDFVGAGAVVVEHATLWFELAFCAVTLFTAAGTPAIVVDGSDDATDTQRRRYVQSALVADPLFPLVAETRAPFASDDVLAFRPYMTIVRGLGYTGPDLYFMLLPILEPDGLLGTIHCGRRRAFTAQMRRDLNVLATHVSVRLTQLGITTTNELAQLSARQHEVARLAARGLANHQIAASLGVSENTIKKHLKDVFVRLEVCNRTELAARLARAGRRGDPPVGITRSGAVVITRSA